MKKNTSHRDGALLLATLPTALLMISRPGVVRAEDYFDPAALELSSAQQKTADLHYFATAGGQQPGTWPVTIWVNDQQVSEGNITFVEENGTLVPVLTAAQLAEYGVNVSAFSSFERLHDGETFTRIGQYIPDASSRFDFPTQRLNLSIPQAAMNVQREGYIDPARWDEGIPAAFVDYTLSGAQTGQSTHNGRSTFLNLRSGVNLGPWRLRNTSSMQYDSTRRLQSLSTYLQRDVAPLKSQLRIGDTYTSGEVFDSVQFRGVQLMSNEEMLPDSLRGFAPVIRGVAHSNAKVTISQHGYVIYETYVSPGAFAIKDLYPTAQSGDLEVNVKESDGSERTFTQPFSSVPFMLREERVKYSLSAGRFHPGHDESRTPAFIQSTLFYGLPAAFTLSGGTQLADDYYALALGVGHSLGKLGSLGTDVTLADTTTPSGKRYRGHSLRAQYQKSFARAGTSFSLASYRYSSSGFYDFSEAMRLEQRYGLVDNKRTREEVAISQTLGEVGNLSLSAYVQDYWHNQSSDKTLHAGFYSAWKGISWGLGYYYTQSSGHNNPDRSWSFNITIPLGGSLASSSVSYTTSSDNRGYTSHQVSMYGSVPKSPNLYYAVQQGYASQGQGSNSGASLDYHGSYGQAQLGYRHDRDSSQLTWGASGSIVAHPHGITLGQSLGDSFAIVRAPGAVNVAVENGSNVHTDWRGYAVVPALTAWHKNVITLDTESMTSDTDVEQFGATVIPGGGAVVEANFRTHIGHRVLFTLHDQSGPVPFGASAQLVGDRNAATGMVADGGMVYLSGIPDTGTLEVNWNDKGEAHRCTLPFHIAADQPDAVKRIEAACLSQ